MTAPAGGTVHARMLQIEANLEGNYWAKLLQLTGGGLESAARADLTYDGEMFYADMRRAPFAGDPELKALLTAAVAAQAAFRAALLDRVWAIELPEAEEPTT